jgi:hypothetical protein
MSRLSDLTNYSQIVQAVVVVISLIFVVYELRQNRELAKAANTQALTEHAASFNSMLIQDGKLAELWYSFGRELDGATASDRLRYREMLVQWLIFHENIYRQHKNGLLDEETYNSWLWDLKHTVKNHNLGAVTPSLQEVFPGSFGQHLLELKSEATKATP